MDHELVASLFQDMLQIREFERTAFKFFQDGRITSSLPPYSGLEAVAAGISSVIEKRDYLICSKYSFAHYLALGGSLERGLAELLGKATGCCQGRGGPFSFFDLANNFFGGIQSCCSHLPAAVGIAFAENYFKNNGITVCLLTPEDVNTGSFHEALSLASAWEAPIIFIIEHRRDPKLADETQIEDIEDLSLRALGYPLARDTVQGHDIFAIRSSVYTAHRRAREQKVPTLIEITGNPIPLEIENASFEDKNDSIMMRDPINLLREKLISFEMRDSIREVEMQMKKSFEQGIRFAIDSPAPDLDAALNRIYNLQESSYA